ncbi:hypothetical protein Hamer_G025545 [Homarus americanus]|uniref:Uncharacterized protein n=1 Tax=Homarus americanus TaxID=6706 RepID=A0A8J5ML39_HOMAM|nr:hypothetical protein Hamer_G025545 [Homarus americanus]
MIEEFEVLMEMKKSQCDSPPKQMQYIQKAYFTNVQSLKNAINELRNPFTDNSTDLLVLHCRDLADPAVAETVWNLEKLGQELYDSYFYRFARQWPVWGW